MSQKATRLPTKTDRLLASQKKVNELYALNRLRITPKSVQNPSFGSAGAGGDVSSAAESNSLKTQGDSMIGPIAFFPALVFIDTTTTPTNPSINIAPTNNDVSDYSTYVLATPPGAGSDLRTIFGASFSGQLLYLQGTTTTTITLKNGDATDGGNIITGNGGDLIIDGAAIVTLIFDPAASADPAVSGAWRVVAGGEGEEGSLFILGLTVDQVLPVVIDWDENFQFGDTTKIIDRTATNPGVFQLVGDVFNLDALLSVEMDTAGQGTEALLAWEESTTVNGTFTIIPNPRARGGVYNGGRAAFSTQPHANAIVDARAADVFVRVAINEVVGTVLTVLNAASTGTISTVGGAGGGGGGGGATSLDELSDVTLTSPTTDQVLTFNGTLWVNQTNPSGGMATNLGNMVDPTVPTVPLKMNSQDILQVNNLDFDGVSSSILGLVNLDFFQTAQSINSLSPGLTYQAGATQHHQFLIGGANAGSFEDVGGSVLRLNMFSNSIDDVKDINFNGAAVIPTNIAGIGFNTAGATNFMQYNAPLTTEFHQFSLAGNTRLTVNLNGISVPATVTSNAVQLQPNTAPLVEGNMRLVGSDILMFSGGAERNISDILPGGAGNQISQGNSSVTVNDLGTGVVNVVVDGAPVVDFSNSVGIVHQKTTSFTGNTLTSLGDTTPNGNHVALFGGSTLFWAIGYFDRINFQNTGNFITGDSNGIDYNTSGSDPHEFKIGGATKGRINLTNFDFFEDLLMNANNINMENGDILNVDFMSMNGNGSLLSGLDTLTFHNSGSFINLAGGDLLNVGQLFTDDIQIGGDLDHNGTRIGFFNNSTQTIKSVPDFSLTGNNSTDILLIAGTVNSILAALGVGSGNTGYGLFNVT